MTSNSISISAAGALKALGASIRTARLKRRISVKDFADRVGVSESTVSRLERGDPGVSIGTLAMASLVLGEINRITDFLDAGSDDTGLLLDRENLPKRIDGKRKRRSAQAEAKATESDPVTGDDDEHGVAF